MKYLPITGVLGVDVKIKNEKLTNKITRLPYSLGKRDVLRCFLKENPKYVPVFGMGDSVNGDYPFLTYIAGLGGISSFVIKPSTSQETITLINNLALVPFYVTGHIGDNNLPSNRGPEINPQLSSKNCQNNALISFCMPRIPFCLYLQGQILPQS